MFLTTLTHQLRIARNEANEDAALLDLTTSGNYGNMPAVLSDTGIGVIDIVGEDRHESIKESPVNGIEFYFCGGVIGGRKFGWRILAWKACNGPARIVAQCGGALSIIGQQAVVRYPHNNEVATNKFWADGLVISNYNWPKRVRTTDTTGVLNSVSSVWFDCCGYRFYKVEITNADGIGMNASNVAVYWSFW